MAKDWKHQAYEYRVGREKRARALIWPMRSGKSKACIDKACFQLEHGNIDGVIVIAPNGVHLNWCDNEIPKWGWPEVGPHVAFAWETPKRGMVEQDMKFRKMIAHKGPKWFCLNMESLKHLDCRRHVKAFIKACGQHPTRPYKKFMLIISEVHHFGRAGSKRTYFARSLASHAMFVQTETGTPILTGPMRAFSQFEILEPRALGFEKFGEFKNYFAEWEKIKRGGHTYDKIVKYQNLDELRERIAKWTSVVLRSDLEDMPPLIQTERPVVMTDKCRVTYLEMVARHLAEVGDDQVVVRDAGPRMMKLQQILHGYVMDTENNRILDIDPDASIYEAAIDEIEGTLPGKSLVWCRYKADIARLKKKLGKRFGEVVEFHGNLTTAARTTNRIRFNTDPKVGVCIGTPDTGGEGLDFSGADAVIFFSIPPNARMIAQAQERATVKGGKSISVVRIRHYGTVDDRLWSIVDGNAAIAEQVTGKQLRDLLLQTDC